MAYTGYNFGEVFVNALIAARERRQQKQLAAEQRGHEAYMQNQVLSNQRILAAQAERAATRRQVSEQRHEVAMQEDAQDFTETESIFDRNLRREMLAAQLRSAEGIAEGNQAVERESIAQRRDAAGADNSAAMARVQLERDKMNTDDERFRNYQEPLLRLAIDDASRIRDARQTMAGQMRNEYGEALTPTSALIRQPEAWQRTGTYRSNVIGNLVGNEPAIQRDMPSTDTITSIANGMETARRGISAALDIYDVDPEQSRAILNENLQASAVSYGQLAQHSDKLNDQTRRAFEADVSRIQSVIARLDGSGQALVTWNKIYAAYSGTEEENQGPEE